MVAGEIRRTITVSFERLIALASAHLMVKEVSRVDVWSQIHRRVAGTGKDISVEFLDAERRFQKGFATQNQAFAHCHEKSSLLKVRRNLLRIECIQSGIPGLR